MVKYHRVTVHDQKVCETCAGLANLPARTMAEWGSSGQAPGTADTQCYPNCRCVLVPSTIEDIQALSKKDLQADLNTLIKDTKTKMITDISSGYSVTLKSFEKVVGIKTLPYTTIAQMEQLIVLWKIDNKNATLPKEFSNLNNIDKQITWLKSELI